MTDESNEKNTDVSVPIKPLNQDDTNDLAIESFDRFITRHKDFILTLIDHLFNKSIEKMKVEFGYHKTYDFTTIIANSLIIFALATALTLLTALNKISGETFVGFVGVLFGVVLQFGFNLPKRYEKPVINEL